MTLFNCEIFINGSCHCQRPNEPRRPAQYNN